MAIFRAMTSILIVAYLLPHTMVLDEYTRHRLLLPQFLNQLVIFDVYTRQKEMAIFRAMTSILVVAYLLPHS